MAATSPNHMPPTLLAAQLFSFALSYVVIQGFWEFDDVSSALAFYGVYHRYGWNQVIHFFGVPGIIWSLLIFLVQVPLPFVAPVAKDASQINYGIFMVASYCIFYLSIDPLGAILYAPVLYGMYASALTIVKDDRREAKLLANGQPLPWYGTGKALRTALLVHVLCWYLQIHPGHKVIEGAQPAVLESVGGALTVGPLFAFYEGLWKIGIHRELQETTLRLVDDYTREICSERGVGAMKVCQSLLL
eukprot:jgi/Psemu1/300058/fgenesh1_kg.5_\